MRGHDFGNYAMGAKRPETVKPENPDFAGLDSDLSINPENILGGDDMKLADGAIELAEGALEDEGVIEGEEGVIEGEGAAEGEGGMGEESMGAPAGFDPLDPSVGGEGYDYEENLLGLPVRHPIYGYYMGRAPRKEREERAEYVRDNAYEGREPRAVR